LRLEEIIGESKIEYSDADYDYELVWENLNDTQIIYPSKLLFDEVKNLTDNFTKHPLDVYESPEISILVSRIQQLLELALRKFPWAKIILVLKYMLFYFSTTTYPE
jgi:hypothetical protein